jgi:hypothetical protein
MKVYLVVLEDRHTDVQIEVFAEQPAALARAAEIVAEYDHTPDEDDLEEASEWPYFRRVSVEGDCVTVDEFPVMTSARPTDT